MKNDSSATTLPTTHIQSHTIAMEFLETTERFDKIRADLKRNRENRSDKYADAENAVDDALLEDGVTDKIKMKQARRHMRNVQECHNNIIREKEGKLSSEMTYVVNHIESVDTARRDIVRRQRQFVIFEAQAEVNHGKRHATIMKLNNEIELLNTAVYCPIDLKMKYA
jgi:hypothetical protein